MLTKDLLNTIVSKVQGNVNLQILERPEDMYTCVMVIFAPVKGDVPCMALKLSVRKRNKKEKKRTTTTNTHTKQNKPD